jgi:putative transcriptional regulator
MWMTDQRYLTGQLLLALPGIGDPRFERAVIAMCSHDAEGAMGIGIGSHRPDFDLHTLLDQFKISTEGIAKHPVHIGGPVEPQRGFVLHSLDWGGQGTLQVGNRWALSSTLDILRVIGTPKGPSRWLIALGYAGWGAGQLDGEMKRHGWHVTGGSDDLIFDTEPKQRWHRAFADAGIDDRLLSPNSGTA